MAKKLTVTPFPKDMRAVFKQMSECAAHKSHTIAIQTCGLLYVLSNPRAYNDYPMNMCRVSGLMVSDIISIMENPNEALLLVKYEDDQDDTEEDGEVSEP
nr:MAG TPA: hypothetical protein [Caudoviricetes sp.]